MKVTIEHKKNHEHIVGKEWKEVYEGDNEEKFATRDIQEAVEEYEANLNANGFELGDDQDKVNEVYAVTELQEGEYSFDCGDFTYYITIEK